MSELQIPEIKVSYKSGKSKTFTISSSKGAYTVIKELFNADTIRYNEEFLVLFM